MAYLARVRQGYRDRMFANTPSDLVRLLKVYLLTSSLHDGEPDESFQTLFQDVVLAKLGIFELNDLSGLIKASGQLHARLGWPDEAVLDLYLETATARLSTAVGEDWVLLAHASNRLTVQTKARAAGSAFIDALIENLPSRLELLGTGELVFAINGWPSTGLDDFGKKMIDSLIAQSIDKLHTFEPSELAHLVKGLKRPMTVSGESDCQVEVARQSVDIKHLSIYYTGRTIECVTSVNSCCCCDQQSQAAI